MKDQPRFSDCEGKEPYASKQAAMESIARRKARARRAHAAHKDRGRIYARLTTYRCDKCHHWHVGGSYKPRKVL